MGCHDTHNMLVTDLLCRVQGTQQRGRPSTGSCNLHRPSTRGLQSLCTLCMLPVWLGPAALPSMYVKVPSFFTLINKGLLVSSIAVANVITL